MSTILYGLIQDGGDGSSSLQWYADSEKVDYLLAEDECYYANEGSPAVTITIPDGVTPEQLGINGVDYTTLEEDED